MSEAHPNGRMGKTRGRELRMKAIKDALVEFVTGKADAEMTRAVLADNRCDESEITALLKSAPATITKRRKPKYKGEIMPLDLVGGSFPKVAA